jgi:hypothetical protein
MPVKDRWVGPRKHVLNVPISCWYMGLVSLVVGYQQMVGFAPHCFNGWLGREIGFGPVDRSAVVLWIGSGAFFSGVVVLLNSIDDYERGSYTRTM